MVNAPAEGGAWHCESPSPVKTLRLPLPGPRREKRLHGDKLATVGKQSARDARGIFERHVFLAFPDLAAQPARSVTARDVVAILRRLTEQGKGRTAGKLRSSLRAAYALALRAELDPEAPVDLIRCDLTANPVAPTDALGAHNRARDRVLSESALRAFWLALDAESPNTRDALLLGGQCLQQLLRVEAADVDLDARVIAPRDGKGARKQPRIHALPLCDDALSLVTPLVERARATPVRLLFSTMESGRSRWRRCRPQCIRYVRPSSKQEQPPRRSSCGTFDAPARRCLPPCAFRPTSAHRSRATALAACRPSTTTDTIAARKSAMRWSDSGRACGRSSRTRDQDADRLVVSEAALPSNATGT